MPGTRRECSRSSRRRSSRRLATSAVAFGAGPRSATRNCAADSCTKSQASGVAVCFSGRAGLRAGLRSRAIRMSGAAGCSRSRSSATPARGAKALGVARNDRDALQALLGREVGERGQHALELRARGVRGLGAGGRAPEHHREVLDAREREGARHVGGGEALHVRSVAAEVAEAREDDEPRREAAAADRQHEDLSGRGADRAPPREVADRAVQHLVDRLRGARGLHVREGAEHDRGGCCSA